MSALRIRSPKYCSFSFSISPSNEYSGLISFRMDWFGLLAVQGILESLLQHCSSKTSVLQYSAFFMVQPSHPYMMASLLAQRLKHLPAMQETRVRSLGREEPLEKEMATHSIFLPGEYPGERSLVGYRPLGPKELDMIHDYWKKHRFDYMGLCRQSNVSAF